MVIDPSSITLTTDKLQITITTDSENTLVKKIITLTGTLGTLTTNDNAIEQIIDVNTSKSLHNFKLKKESEDESKENQKENISLFIKRDCG